MRPLLIFAAAFMLVLVLSLVLLLPSFPVVTVTAQPDVKTLLDSYFYGTH